MIVLYNTILVGFVRSWLGSLLPRSVHNQLGLTGEICHFENFLRINCIRSHEHL